MLQRYKASAAASLAIAIAISSAVSAPVSAQTAEDTSAPQVKTPPAAADDFHSKDNNIVVTAPYFERFELLAGTSAMTGEELSRNTRAQLGDVLTSLPGVSATSFSPGASRPVLRGYQGNRVSVLTDGIGTIDVSNTSADHAVTIDTLTAERIEVLRGPAVLLFGGQAVGGAVNVIDKRIPRAIPDEVAHVDVLAGYGSAADEWSGGASITAPVSDRFVVHVDGSYLDADDLRSGGFVLSPALRAERLEFAAEERSEGNIGEAEEAEELAALRGDIPNSYVRTWTFGSGAAFIDDGGSLGVSFGIYDTRYGVPGRPGAGHHGEEGEGTGDIIGEAEEEEEGSVSIDLRQYRFDLRGSVNMGGFFDKLNIRAGYSDYTHTEFEGDEVGTVFDSQGIEGRAELVQAETNGWRGATGIQYQIRDFAADGAEAFVPLYTTNQIGIFTLQEIQLGALELEGALRFDRTDLTSDGSPDPDNDSFFIGSRDFDVFSAALGLGYTLGNVKIGANLSRTGRAPSAEELFSNGPHIATQAFEIGDPNLDVERSWNGEAYLRYETDAASFAATVFGNRFSNFIYEVETGAEEDELPVFQYLQSKARVYGFEVEGSARLAEFGSTQVIVDGVADYVRAKISGDGPAPRIPPLRVLGGVELQNANFDLRGEVEWADDQTRVTEFETPTDGFTMVNAALTWRPWGRERNVALLLSANNIFDVTARRAASFTKDFVPLAGRDIRASVRLSF